MKHCYECGTALGPAPMFACSRCGNEHWRNPRPCAGAIVDDRGLVLLAQRACDPWREHWDIPGGYCEIDEHPAETAVREVEEETGYKVRVLGPPFGIWREPGNASRSLPNICIYYRAEVLDAPSGSFAPNHEIARIGWYSLESLPRYLAFPAHIPDVLRTWFAIAKRPEQ